MNNAEKIGRLKETLKYRPLDSEWHQVAELMADIIHWCDDESNNCGDLAGERENIWNRILADARQSYRRHHCVFCHDETDNALLATICDGHAHLVKDKPACPVSE